jgi:hypothetical protein
MPFGFPAERAFQLHRNLQKQAVAAKKAPTRSRHATSLAPAEEAAQFSLFARKRYHKEKQNLERVDSLACEMGGGAECPS